MPATTPLIEVAQALLLRVDEMTDAMVEGYRERIPEYPRLLKRHREDIHRVSRGALLLFLQLLIQRREASDQELQLIRASGRNRAAQGLELESMLMAYSIGREVAWKYLAEASESAAVDEDEVAAAAILMSHFMEKLALKVTQGFLDHMKHAYESERQRMEVLVEIAKAMSRSLDLDEVVSIGLSRIRGALEVVWTGLWLVSLEKGVLRLAGQQADTDWESGPLGDGYREVLLRKPGLGADTLAKKPVLYGTDDLPEPIAANGAELLMVVPLLDRERPIGLLGVASRQKADLPTHDREFLVAMAEQMAVAVHQVQEHTREARTDFLTGLANRHEFDSFLRRELARAERFGDSLSLAMIDVDELKRINDVDGHKAGDDALRIVGTTLKGTVRSLDLAARIGGDEFALVMPQTDATGARDVIRRFQQHLADAVAVGTMRVGVSSGVAEWKEGMTLDTLSAAADAELYESKRNRDSTRQNLL